MKDTKKDQQWLDSFTLELAHRGVSGRDIGDAKASVESHLADSGEAAEEAFGDPEAYAQALEFRATPESGIPRALLPSLLGILGLMYYLPAIGPAVQGQPVSFTGTEFALFVVLGLSMLLVVKNIFRLVKRWWILLAIWAAVVGIGVLASLLPLLLDLPELEANSAIVATVSGVLIIGAGFWTRAEIANSDNLVTPPNATQTEDTNGAVERVMVALAPWLITGGAAIFTAGAFLAA
ncbi:hypothetical protein [Arthrobacter flavus]|uniref:DUF1700 domain-containing protein n=1 Tax=Arthrobacter flavus TaxID=95172 RepID=A0ABW4Q6B9_9MICC